MNRHRNIVTSCRRYNVVPRCDLSLLKGAERKTPEARLALTQDNDYKLTGFIQPLKVLYMKIKILITIFTQLFFFLSLCNRSCFQNSIMQFEIRVVRLTKRQLPTFWPMDESLCHLSNSHTRFQIL